MTTSFLAAHKVFSTGGLLGPGSTFKLKIAQPGVYHFYCALHEYMGMVLTITVKA